MYCIKCGTKNDDNTQFCVNCGNNLNQNQSNDKTSSDKKTDGLAIASLILGISSIVIPCLILPLAIIGLILGIVSKSKSGVKIAGIIINTIALVLCFLLIALYFIATPSIEKAIENQWNEIITEEKDNSSNDWTNIETEEKDSKPSVKSTDLKKKENGKTVIYFFRGEGCPHCEEAEEWFKSIEDKYGNMFKIEDYETWYDKDNAEFMEKVAESRGEEANGVPYIIIGDKSWMGFTESYESEMLEEIEKVYNE